MPKWIDVPVVDTRNNGTLNSKFVPFPGRCTKKYFLSVCGLLPAEH